MRRSVLALLSGVVLSAARGMAAASRKSGADPLTTSKAGPSGSHGYRVERVALSSESVPIIGLLFVPDGAKPAPGVVALGPFGFVKEQAPMQYATRLAREGYVVLIFDPRYSGESGGEPRRLESPSAKIQDVRAAIRWLATRPEVDPARIGALGICQGASEMIAATSDEHVIRALALVSGQYLYRANLLGFFGGGGLTLDQRIARGRAARAEFEEDGTVEYTPVVSISDKSVGLPWSPIHDWYQPWTTAKWGEPSRWENRYATLSDAEVWSFDVDSHARRLRTATLIVHGDQSDGLVAAARHIHDLIPATPKRLVIVDGVFHTRFYDDPVVVDPAAAEVASWFDAQLR